MFYHEKGLFRLFSELTLDWMVYSLSSGNSKHMLNSHVLVILNAKYRRSFNSSQIPLV